jgi:hypothetical protein
VGTPAQLDLVVDLNTMDDTGLPSTFLDDALRPERILKVLTSSSASARSERGSCG